jgi:hypothetical protein
LVIEVIAALTPHIYTRASAIREGKPLPWITALYPPFIPPELEVTEVTTSG